MRERKSGLARAGMAAAALGLISLAAAGCSVLACSASEARALRTAGDAQTIITTESGIFLIAADGWLYLRSGRYDAREFRRATGPPVGRLAMNLLNSSGRFELRENMQLVLLPSGDDKTDPPNATIRSVGDQRSIWNVLGSTGWYEVRTDMQLVLYPAADRELLPGLSFGNGSAGRAEARSLAINPGRTGTYRVGSDGALLVMDDGTAGSGAAGQPTGK